jgi:rare lipoprotein A (peptidoglycan hydrolase)
MRGWSVLTRCCFYCVVGSCLAAGLPLRGGDAALTAPRLQLSAIAAVLPLPPAPKPAPPRPKGQVGVASWYGPDHNGRVTASGAIFDANKLTAAHRSLPFNTEVKVTNLRNGKSVNVVINDRGPAVRGRAIDLSEQAARRLGMTRKGLAPVRIEPMASSVALE